MMSESALHELDAKVERLRSQGWTIGRVFAPQPPKPPKRPKPIPRCRVCGHPQGKYKLHRDHCHATGKQRDLLCHGCNLALGFIKDDPETARALADYLEMHAPKESNSPV
jgi:hypothetical protein